MRVVAFASSKGGVGKSTLCILCARYLAAAGYKVLCVDLDSQNSLSFYFNHQYIDSKNIVLALRDNQLEPHVCEVRDNIFVVASGTQLENVKITDAFALKKLLVQGVDYDFCIIDASPIDFQIVINCTCASDLVVTPVSQSLFEWKSANIFYNNLKKVARDQSSKWRILFNKYQMPRTKNPKSLLNQYAELFEDSFHSLFLYTLIPILPRLTRLIDSDTKISLLRASHEKIFNSIQSLAHEIFEFPCMEESAMTVF